MKRPLLATLLSALPTFHRCASSSLRTLFPLPSASLFLLPPPQLARHLGKIPENWWFYAEDPAPSQQPSSATAAAAAAAAASGRGLKGGGGASTSSGGGGSGSRNCAIQKTIGSLEPKAHCQRRVTELGKWLSSRPEKFIVLIGHCSFWHEFRGKTEKKMANGEMRCLRF